MRAPFAVTPLILLVISVQDNLSTKRYWRMIARFELGISDMIWWRKVSLGFGQSHTKTMHALALNNETSVTLGAV
jgi:hypothetical protein